MVPKHQNFLALLFLSSSLLESPRLLQLPLFLGTFVNLILDDTFWGVLVLGVLWALTLGFRFRYGECEYSDYP